MTLLGAIAAYKGYKLAWASGEDRVARDAEDALVNACFPKELQLQILADFGGPISVFCANRNQRRNMILAQIQSRELMADSDVTPSVDSNEDSIGSPSVDLVSSTTSKKSLPYAIPPIPTRKGSLHIDDPSVGSSEASVPSRKGSLSNANSPGRSQPTSPFGRLFSYYKPGTTSEPQNLPPSQPQITPPPLLISPSTSSKDWDPEEAKAIAGRTILLLWAIVDTLKRNMSSMQQEPMSKSDSVDSASLSKNDDLPMPENPLPMPPEVPSKDSNLDLNHATPPDVEVAAAATPPESHISHPLSREYEILQPLQTTTLISLLHMIQAIETLLFEKLTLIKFTTSKTTPLISPSEIHTETYSPHILYKISLGWGAVGVMLDAASKEELGQLAEQGAVVWEGAARKGGFLVETILNLLAERGNVEPMELIKL